MKKIFAICSIAFASLGLKNFAEAMDSRGNDIVNHLSKAGLSLEEIGFLNELSIDNPELFKKAVLEDLRIKGELKREIFATANKGGGPCIHGEQ